mgnify:CR=1 FL=1
MMIIAFVSSKKFGQLVDVSADGKFSVIKICDMKQRRRQTEMKPEHTKVFENKYEGRHWYEPVPHLDRIEALFYTRLAATSARGAKALRI